jgi:hypothetical protein
MDHRTLKLRCESRADWIRICAEVLFFCTDLDPDSAVGQAFMDTIGVALAEPTAQDFIDHPRVHFEFDEDTPGRYRTETAGQPVDPPGVEMSPNP